MITLYFCVKHVFFTNYGYSREMQTVHSYENRRKKRRSSLDVTNIHHEKGKLVCIFFLQKHGRNTKYIFNEVQMKLSKHFQKAILSNHKR